MTTKLMNRKEWEKLNAKERLEYVRTLETLLDARDETLALIPDCPTHGAGCQPHYQKWIKERMTLEERHALARKEAFIEALTYASELDRANQSIQEK